MLDGNRLNTNQIGSDWPLGVSDHVGVTLFREAFEPQAHDSRCKAIAYVLPDHWELRMMVQRAAFTIHGVGIPLGELPNADDFLFRFEIPEESKVDLRNELRALGLRQEILFPDLDALARGVAGDYPRGVNESWLEPTDFQRNFIKGSRDSES